MVFGRRSYMGNFARTKWARVMYPSVVFYRRSKNKKGDACFSKKETIRVCVCEALSRLGGTGPFIHAVKRPDY